MKKLHCLFLPILSCSFCNAQNLILNGDFEQYSSCPTAISQLYQAISWTQPTTGTSDYFNACAIVSTGVSVPSNVDGFQYAHSGLGYSGIVLFQLGQTFREYIEGTLDSPLVANVCYNFSMYVNPVNKDIYTTDAIGVYFSDTIVAGVNNFDTLPYIPQINNSNGYITDTLNWTSITGNYLAHGGEKYLIIGNFKSNNSTAILYYISSGVSEAFFYIDDVFLARSECLGINEEPNENITLQLYPNPFIDKLHIAVDSNQPTDIVLYDITSRKILHQRFQNSTVINTEQLSAGLYFYEITGNPEVSGEVIARGKLVKE